MKATLLASACAAATLAVLTPGLALAQEQDPATNQSQDQATTLEEVIVTATRRAERAQDVPISVTTLSQEDLNERGIVNYDGLAIATPGVTLGAPILPAGKPNLGQLQQLLCAGRGHQWLWRQSAEHGGHLSGRTADLVKRQLHHSRPQPVRRGTD